MATELQRLLEELDHAIASAKPDHHDRRAEYVPQAVIGEPSMSKPRSTGKQSKRRVDPWKVVRLRFDSASEADITGVLERALGGSFTGAWGEPWTPPDGVPRRARPFEVDMQVIELVRAEDRGLDAGVWTYEIELEEPSYLQERGRVATIVQEARRAGLTITEMPPAPELRRPPEAQRSRAPRYVRTRFRFPGVPREELLRVCYDAKLFIVKLGLRRMSGNCLAVDVRDPEEWADAGQAATLRRVLVQGGIPFEERPGEIVEGDTAEQPPSLDATLDAAQAWAVSNGRAVPGMSDADLHELARLLDVSLPEGLRAVLARGLWGPLRLHGPEEMRSSTASLDGFSDRRGWIAIADDGAGDVFVVRAKGKGADHVHFADHETHEITSTGVTLGELVAGRWQETLVYEGGQEDEPG